MWLSFTVPFLSSGTAQAPLSTNYAENNRNGFSLGMLACPWQLEEWVCERSKLFRILLLFPVPTPFTFPHSKFSSLIGVTSVFSRYFTKMSCRLVWSIWAILVSSMDSSWGISESPQPDRVWWDGERGEWRESSLRCGFSLKDRETQGRCRWRIGKTKGMKKITFLRWDGFESVVFLGCQSSSNYDSSTYVFSFSSLCWIFGYHFSSFEVWSIEERLEIITHSHHVYIIVYRYCIIYTVNIHQCWTCLVGKYHPLSFVKKPTIASSSKALVAATAAVGSNDCQGSWTLHQRRRRARGWNVGGWWLGPRCVCFLLVGGHLEGFLFHFWELALGTSFFLLEMEKCLFLFFLVRI